MRASRQGRWMWWGDWNHWIYGEGTWIMLTKWGCVKARSPEGPRERV